MFEILNPAGPWLRNRYIESLMVCSGSFVNLPRTCMPEWWECYPFRGRARMIWYFWGRWWVWVRLRCGSLRLRCPCRLFCGCSCSYIINQRDAKEDTAESQHNNQSILCVSHDCMKHVKSLMFFSLTLFKSFFEILSKFAWNWVSRNRKFVGSI